MLALKFSEKEGLRLESDHAKPDIGHGEALIKVLRAGICSTDLEILKGYVPGYNQVLGHEFVGCVESCSSEPSLVGERIVGEINCRCHDAKTYSDPIFERNHSPGRSVLGIISKDGTMAEYIKLPVGNLHIVPDTVSDQDACFAEPLAAACRVAEQQILFPQGQTGTHFRRSELSLVTATGRCCLVLQQGDKVAVIGDGKLGLLVAQMLVLQGHTVAHFGKHEHKLSLVSGTQHALVTEQTAERHAAAFDVVVEASGSSQGIKLASAMTRPMGSIILKSTCSAVSDASMPAWSDIANDVVVNEKRLQGSRCGPFPPALEALKDARVQELVRGMLTKVYPLSEGPAAIEAAQTKGVLKVQLVMQ